MVPDVIPTRAHHLGSPFDTKLASGECGDGRDCDDSNGDTLADKCTIPAERGCGARLGITKGVEGDP